MVDYCGALFSILLTLWVFLWLMTREAIVGFVMIGLWVFASYCILHLLWVYLK